MRVVYASPISKGPPRYRLYRPRDIVKHFHSNRDDILAANYVFNGPFLIGARVRGVLHAVSMAALLCREQDRDLRDVHFDKEKRTVWFRVPDEKYAGRYQNVVDSYMSVDLLKVSQDRWGQKLFDSASGALV